MAAHWLVNPGRRCCPNRTSCERDFVGQVLIPTEKVFQIRNGKKVSKEKAYLPGYVLVEASLVGEVPHVIKSIPNVIGFAAPGFTR